MLGGLTKEQKSEYGSWILLIVTFVIFVLVYLFVFKQYTELKYDKPGAYIRYFSKNSQGQLLLERTNVVTGIANAFNNNFRLYYNVIPCADGTNVNLVDIKPMVMIADVKWPFAWMGNVEITKSYDYLLPSITLDCKQGNLTINKKINVLNNSNAYESKSYKFDKVFKTLQVGITRRGNNMTYSVHGINAYTFNLPTGYVIPDSAVLVIGSYGSYIDNYKLFND